MSDRQLTLSPAQIAHIKQMLAYDDRPETEQGRRFDGANSWKAYAYISNLINHSDQVDEKTKLWFERAARINRNDTLSSANIFVRSVTQFGLEWGGRDASAEQVQEMSNAIGNSVITDVIENRGIPALSAMISHDLRQSTIERGQDIAGWGGSFYYWNLEVDLGKENGGVKPIGEHILGNPEWYEKFIAVNAAAVDETFLSEAGEQQFWKDSDLIDMARFGVTSELPKEIKSQIIGTALVTSHGESYAADPNRISDWSYNQEKRQWVRASGDFAITGFQTAPSRVASDLDRIRDIRLKKSEVAKFGRRHGAHKPKGLFGLPRDHPYSRGPSSTSPRTDVPERQSARGDTDSQPFIATAGHAGRMASLEGIDDIDIYQVAEDVFSTMTLDDWANGDDDYDPFEHLHPFRDGATVGPDPARRLSNGSSGQARR